MYAAPIILCSSVFALYATLSPYLSVLVRSLGFSPAASGLILGAAEIAGIGAPLLAGALSDKFKDYRITLLTALGFSIASAAAIFFLKAPWLCAVFSLVLTASLRSAVPLQDACITLNLKQNGNYGVVRATGSFAFVLVVVFLQYTPFMKPAGAHGIAFWALTASCAVFCVILLLPRSFFRRYPKTTGAVNTQNIPAPSQTKRKFWTAQFAFGLLLIFLNRLAFSPIQTYIALYAVEYLKWDAVGLLSAVSAAAETPFIFISGALIRKFGTRPLIALTTLAVALRLILIAAFPFRAVLAASQLLHALTFGIFHPAAVSFVTLSAPPEKRALGMAVYISLGTGLPTLLGNIAGGFIIGLLGYRALYAGFSAFAFLGLALFLMTNKSKI